MPTKYDLNSMLRTFSLRTRKATLNFPQFSAFVQKYVDKLNNEGTAVDKSIASPVMLGHELESLAQKGGCTLEQENGKIRNIHYPKYYYYETLRLYAALEHNSEIPFPSEKQEKIIIPTEAVIAVDVKKEFSDWLDKNDEGYVIRLNFPEGIDSVLCTINLLSTKMLDYSVQKIRQYLNTHKNAEYMRSKLKGIFPTKDNHLKDLMNAVLTQNRQAVSSLLNPTDFTFQFWTHLATSILQEYRQKNNMTPMEHSFCQAAYMIGFYNMYYKSQQTREKDREAALKGLRYAFSQRPHYFTINDIYAFRDKSGIPIAKRVSLDDINSYLTKMTQYPDKMDLPAVVRLNAPGNKEYFVPRERIIVLFLTRKHDARRRFRLEFIEHWANLLNSYRTHPAMKDDDAFDAEIAQKIRTEEPLLSALLRFDVLYIAKETTQPGYEAVKETEECFDGQQLAPVSAILRLDREKILREAKLKIPFWKTIPVLVHLVMFFKGFAKGVRVGADDLKRQAAYEKTNKQISAGDAPSKEINAFERPGSPSSAAGTRKTAKAELISYRSALTALKERITGNDIPIDVNLDSLEAKWNPLIDIAARKNLREDVNSMIRDFMRKLKRGFRIKPPDMKRINDITNRLAENEAFSQIRKIDDFKNYIKLYIIKILWDK
ncbi:MAG: hypothetical protein JXB03_07645 [Spirochaetales bacterium]|nr:hypothetical protein [Spirochaetales bacterium]